MAIAGSDTENGHVGQTGKKAGAASERHATTAVSDARRCWTEQKSGHKGRDVTDVDFSSAPESRPKASNLRNCQPELLNQMRSYAEI